MNLNEKKDDINFNLIRKLVFSGGGMRACIFAGALEFICSKYPLFIENLDTIVGTSMGSIFSLMCCLNYSPKEISELILTTDFKSLQFIEPIKLLSHYGFDSGSGFIDKLKSILVFKDLSPDLTLLELHNFTHKTLIIVVTCLSTHSSYYIDHINEPNLKVVDAIRMSMSIPLLFTACHYNGKVYVDGGILDNFPISIFDPSDKSVLGLKISCLPKSNSNSDSVPNSVVNHNYQINNIQDFIYNNVYCILNEIEYHKCYSHKSRTLELPVCDSISPIDLGMTVDDKEKLIKSGFSTISNYFPN